MKLFAASMIALGLSLSAHAQDASRDNELVTSMNTVDMRYVIESAGFEVTQALSTGIGLVGSDRNGIVFALEGRACGDTPNCVGLDISFTLEGGYTGKDANEINKRWRAIKATALEDGNMFLSRYLILDHGQTLKNVRFNLQNTYAIAGRLLSEIEGRDDADDFLPLTSEDIDWGDDSGAYANDGACDDARFQEEEDVFGYKRNHVLRDATDCRSAFETGALTLFLDFGDNSSANANNGMCEDARFSGSGMSDNASESDIEGDADDCISAYQVGLISRPGSS